MGYFQLFFLISIIIDMKNRNRLSELKQLKRRLINFLSNHQTNSVPTAQGKRKIVKSFSRQGKRREFENFGKTQGI